MVRSGLPRGILHGASGPAPGHGTARLRDACTTRVLVHVAYVPNPDLGWLGWPGGSFAAEAPLIRTAIRPPGSEVTVRQAGPGSYRVLGRSRTTLCRPEVVHGIAGA